MRRVLLNTAALAELQQTIRSTGMTQRQETQADREPRVAEIVVGFTRAFGQRERLERRRFAITTLLQALRTLAEATLATTIRFGQGAATMGEQRLRQARVTSEEPEVERQAVLQRTTLLQTATGLRVVQTLTCALVEVTFFTTEGAAIQLVIEAMLATTREIGLEAFMTAPMIRGMGGAQVAGPRLAMLLALVEAVTDLLLAQR